MRRRSLSLGVLGLIGGGCAARSDAHIEKLRGGTAGELSRPAPKLATLLAFAVHAPEGRAAALLEYAHKTKLSVEQRGARVRVGPFWSRYEATLLAGFTADADVSLWEPFSEGATIDPWLRLRKPYARVPLHVGTRQLLGHRYALVTWELEDEVAVKARRDLEESPVPGELSGFDLAGPTPGADSSAPELAPAPANAKATTSSESTSETEQELYEVVGRGPRFMTRLPWLDALVSSAGLAIASYADETVYLEVRAEPRKGAGKAERLAAFQWGINGREPVFERPMCSLQLGPKGPRLSATRAFAAPGGVTLSTFQSEWTALAAAAEVPLELNEWRHPRWAGHRQNKQTLPDLVTLDLVTEAGSEFESLEEFTSLAR